MPHRPGCQQFEQWRMLGIQPQVMPLPVADPGGEMRDFIKDG
jgi:hypothetical protein